MLFHPLNLRIYCAAHAAAGYKQDFLLLQVFDIFVYEFMTSKRSREIAEIISGL